MAVRPLIWGRGGVHALHLRKGKQAQSLEHLLFGWTQKTRAAGFEPA